MLAGHCDAGCALARTSYVSWVSIGARKSLIVQRQARSLKAGEAQQWSWHETLLSQRLLGGRQSTLVSLLTAPLQSYFLSCTSQHAYTSLAFPARVQAALRHAIILSSFGGTCARMDLQHRMKLQHKSLRSIGSLQRSIPDAYVLGARHVAQASICSCRSRVLT